MAERGSDLFYFPDYVAWKLLIQLRRVLTRSDACDAFANNYEFFLARMTFSVVLGV